MARSDGSGPGGNPGPWGAPDDGPSGDGRRAGQAEANRPNGRPDGRSGNRAGNRGPRPPWQTGGAPDLDELLARLRARWASLRPPTGGGDHTGRIAALAAAALAAAWLASGFYRVQPDQQGVVQRFGAYDRTTGPGLNYHLPWPVETVLRPAVTQINKTEIGFNSSAVGELRIAGARGDGTDRDVLEESQMLTGDENIIDIEFVVFWRIGDPVDYLFNIRTPAREPAAVIKAVAESAMREVIGRTPIQPVLAEARAQVEADVLKEMQTVLNAYHAGVEVTQVQLQRVDPPAAVIDSFRDVQRANTDAERARNEADAYRNDIVPRARGEAAAVVAGADAARQAAVANATGETQRFLSVLAAYRAARDVTLRRMYIETMQEVLSHTQTTILDDQLKGLLPLLPVPGAGVGAAPSGTAR